MTKRRIVITGANRGIGLEMAQLLIAEGHTVYGTARHPGRADALRQAEPAAILQLDLGDTSSVVAFGEALATRTDAIDILVNNAGIVSASAGAEAGHNGPWEFDPDIALELTRINAMGPLLVTRSLIHLLEAGHNPVVLNTSSQMGSMVVGASMTSDVGYNISKAALNMITVTFAASKPNVCFVALHPGWVKTDMGSQAAELEVSESAGAIVQSLLKLTIADTGRFIRWDGEPHPW